MTEWTEERLSQLRALWDEGLSQSQIGAALGVSRSAVGAKVRRINLTPRTVPQWRPDKWEKKRAVTEEIPEPYNPIYLPDDTRDFTARFFDDPLPGRSALDRRKEEGRRL